MERESPHNGRPGPGLADHNVQVKVAHWHY